MNLSISALLRKVQPSLSLVEPTAPTYFASELDAVPRCDARCNFGHCTLMAEPWFTRVVCLEQRRTERSGKPFILLLLRLARANELLGTREALIQQVLAGVTSSMRETDVTGWYYKNDVLGAVFTELGETANLRQAAASIAARVRSSIGAHVGQQQIGLIDISCLIYPNDWDIKNTGLGIDSVLYPQQQGNNPWLQSTGKRMVDIAGSIMALLLFSPLLVLIAAIIKLTSKGPILFRQLRVGQFGKDFIFLKFRSMCVTNDSQVHEDYVKDLIAGNNDIADKGIYKIQNDPRVTPFGRFLRKSSLDELPQLWNVLRGEMSLVGPRPPIPYEVDVYNLWHRRRLLLAKPGITGLWQVTGRSRTTFDEMVRLDLRYAHSSSFWLDAKILLRTPMVVVAGGGAY